MTLTNILVTDTDRRRLGSVLEDAAAGGRCHRHELAALETELDFANGVPPEKVPDDVVTMNSTVVVRDLDTKEAETLTLVYPEHADNSRCRLSVLDPIGRVLLGRRVGQELQIIIPSGRRQIRIECLHYQPERAGDFHL